MRVFKPFNSEKNAAFYADVASRKKRHVFWGGEQRFNYRKVMLSESVRRYFVQQVAQFIKETDHVADIGCGAGVFLPLTAPMCEKLYGVEVAPAFVEQSKKMADKLSLDNVEVIQVEGDQQPFDAESLDVVILVDVIHHLPVIDVMMAEIYRILKPGGTLIVFEPNKMNPLLALACLFDRNEWGLLGLGTKRCYRSLLQGQYEVNRMDYNGLLIGPDGRFYRMIVSFLDNSLVKPWLGWLLPKIFVVSRKVVVDDA